MGEVRPGERLLLADGGTATVTAARTERLTRPVTVYNFEVADWHTYHVGTPETGWVYVHNQCAGFKSFRAAEKHVARAKSGVRGGRGSSIRTKLGLRKPDVTMASRRRIIEVKTGTVRYSRFIRRQIAKDYLAVKNGLRNGRGMRTKQATWYFFKNRRGVVNVDPRILRQLKKAGIHYRVVD